MPSTVVSLRVSPKQAERLQRKARSLGRSPSETGAILLEESLRRDEFAFIDFRDSPAGRQACLQGTRLSVWMVVKIARSYRGNLLKSGRRNPRGTSQDRIRPKARSKSAVNLARAALILGGCSHRVCIMRSVNSGL